MAFVSFGHGLFEHDLLGDKNTTPNIFWHPFLASIKIINPQQARPDCQNNPNCRLAHHLPRQLHQTPTSPPKPTMPKKTSAKKHWAKNKHAKSNIKTQARLHCDLSHKYQSIHRQHP